MLWVLIRGTSLCCGYSYEVLYHIVGTHKRCFTMLLVLIRGASLFVGSHKRHFTRL